MGGGIILRGGGGYKEKFKENGDIRIFKLIKYNLVFEIRLAIT